MCFWKICRSLGLAAVLAIAGVGLTSPASATMRIEQPKPKNDSVSRPQTQSSNSLDWDFKSNHPNKVSLKLYSKMRNHVWPNSSEVWVLDDYGTKTVSVSCQRGEKICYGAWVTGNDKTYWGVGNGGKRGCSDCCYTCGDSTKRKILNP